MNKYFHVNVKINDIFNYSRRFPGVLFTLLTYLANNLPNRAIKIFEKTLTLSIPEQIELEAIMKLLNQPQTTTVMNAINKFADSKTRKFALKLFAEISGEGKR